MRKLIKTLTIEKAPIQGEGLTDDLIFSKLNSFYKARKFKPSIGDNYIDCHILFYPSGKAKKVKHDTEKCLGSKGNIRLFLVKPYTKEQLDMLLKIVKDYMEGFDLTNKDILVKIKELEEFSKTNNFSISEKRNWWSII